MKNVEYCTVNNEDIGTVEVPKICTHGLNVATIRAFIHVFGTHNIFNKLFQNKATIIDISFSSVVDTCTSARIFTIRKFTECR